MLRRILAGLVLISIIACECSDIVLAAEVDSSTEKKALDTDSLETEENADNEDLEVFPAVQEEKAQTETISNGTVIASGTCGDNLTWTLDSTGTLVIDGKGDMNDWNTTTGNPAPWDANREDIVRVTIKDGVTSIGSSAFYQCERLCSTEIPNSVVEIGRYAYDKCYELKEVVIPSSVMSIAQGAFCYCSKLEQVVIQGSDTGMESSVFYGCPGLTTAGPIGSGCAIEFGWTSQIPESAFNNCGSLISVMIPDTIISIGDYAFQYCSNLVSVDVPDTVTNIGVNAFKDCTNLMSVALSDNIEEIGKYVFFN